jgi:lysyl-tRNA synthetase class 1
MADRVERQHWADQVADKILDEGRAPVISTGISPSGEIHIGNLREVLTADAVFRAIRERGIEAGFHFVPDSFDPLRRVYGFLDAASFEPLVGRPLSEIRCPCGEHESYAEHYLLPFLESLKVLRIDLEVVRAEEMYKSGRMTDCVITALERRDEIARILHELTGREMSPDWSPFNPLCEGCGRISSARVVGFSAGDSTVDYSCACGSGGTRPIAGGGKLVWRIDWPARWKVLGVTVEPFGKDHATRGGSYDTGVRIAREVFEIEPPFPVPYEWIRLKGAGDMSSSRGNVLSIARVLEVVPPEVLRYLVLRERPQKSISFDPGQPLLQLVDQVDNAAASGRDERAIELSRAGGFLPVGVPFKHLVVVAQTADFDVERAMSILRRTGYESVEREAVRDRMEYAQRWLGSFAPEHLRFQVRSSLPPEAASLTSLQREFLRKLAASLLPGMDGEAIHNQIYELSGDFSGEVKPSVLFEAIYLSLLGKSRGPRAGWLLAFLGSEFCADRFREAAGEPG